MIAPFVDALIGAAREAESTDAYLGGYGCSREEKATAEHALAEKRQSLFDALDRMVTQ